jgi:hypothetical protein
MDPLTALRSAVMAGKESTVHQEGNDLIIDGQKYAAMSSTAFKVQRGTRNYKLLSLWLQFLTKDKTFADYMRLATEHKLSMQDLVIVTEKKIVLDYLVGVSAAIGHIDTSQLSAGLGASEDGSVQVIIG